MQTQLPSIVGVGRPNGAGKSTTAEALLNGTLSVDEFVNADVIARGLSGFAPEGSGVAAGRIMLARIRKLAEQRATFAFETTLASRSFAPWLRGLEKTDYRVHVVYLWLPSADLRCYASVSAFEPEAMPCRRKRSGAAMRGACGTSSSCTGPWRLPGTCTTMLPPSARAWLQEDAREWPMKSSMRRSGKRSEPVVDPAMAADPILERFMDGRVIEQALQHAVREALIRHKKLGESVAVWRDGKAVILPPEEIPY